MYHSITFMNVDDTAVRKNTLEDWHLIPSSRPVITPPKVQTKYVDIPGADGSLDLTDYLAGRPTFSDREGTIEFIVLNDYNIEGYNYNWSSLYSEIMTYLHGWQKIMILEDDPDYFYKGRFSVDSWTTDQNNSKITVGYKLWPYKMNSLYIFADEFEPGTYRISTTDPEEIALNQDADNGPALYNDDSYIRRTIRQKTSARPRFIKEGSKITFSSSVFPNTYKLRYYRYDTSLAPAKWVFTASGTGATTIDNGSSYTVPTGNGGYYRFCIDAGSNNTFTGSYEEAAKSIKFEYEPDEVL